MRIAFALKRFDLLVCDAAVCEDPAHVACRQLQRFGVSALLVILDAGTNLLMHGLDNIVAAILVERVCKRQAEGVLLLLGGHRRFDAKERVDDLLMQLGGIFRVEKHVVDVRRAAVEGGIEEAELWRGSDVARRA